MRSRYRSTLEAEGFWLVIPESRARMKQSLRFQATCMASRRCRCALADAGHCALAERLAVLPWCYAGDLLEGTIEAAQRIETRIVSDIDNPLVRRHQLTLGVCDAVPRDQHVERGAERFAK